MLRVGATVGKAAPTLQYFSTARAIARRLKVLSDDALRTSNNPRTRSSASPLPHRPMQYGSLKPYRRSTLASNALKRSTESSNFGEANAAAIVLCHAGLMSPGCQYGCRQVW